jgi:hypothetical protein
MKELSKFPNLELYISLIETTSKTDSYRVRSYIPQMPRADATLLPGRDVSSYNILANVSEYLLSVKSISAKAFS